MKHLKVNFFLATSRDLKSVVESVNVMRMNKAYTIKAMDEDS